jgi:hypothetical protein
MNILADESDIRNAALEEGWREPSLTCPHIDRAIESGTLPPAVVEELVAIRDINSQLRYGTWYLGARVEELEAGLKLAFRAINDWVVVYASDMCDDARVEETKLRIRDAGGTLAYVAEINSVLGPLLRALKSDPAPVPATKPFTFADPVAQREHERIRAENKRRERE